MSKYLKLGSDGTAVSDLQRKLKKLGFAIDDRKGYFGQSTRTAVMQFQQSRGLLVDGMIGDETWHDLVEANYDMGSRPLYLKQPHLRGDDVRTIQLWLRTLGFSTGPIDSIYGRITQTAIKEFQSNYGLKSDGIVRNETIEAFYNLKTALERNAEVELPHYEMPSYSSISLFEKQAIVLDVGHGGTDRGAAGPTGLEEADVCEDIGLRLGNLFKIFGSEVSYTKQIGYGRSTAKRIDYINESDTPFVISIHMNHSVNSKAEGISTYYFSSGNISSTEGQRIANYLQHELVTSLQSKDCRVHGKKFNILRLTKIPAVIVEPAFITNPEEERKLKDVEWRQKIAAAIFDGLQHYLKEYKKEGP